MKGLIATLLDAPADARLLLHRGAWVSAGDIRAHADALAEAMAATGDDIHLHATRISHFLAGLLAAAQSGKRIILPAHTQPAYLAEIGCTDETLFNDARLIAANTQAPPKRRASQTNNDPLLVFYTSGSTATPKAVEKNLSRLEREAHELH